MAIFDGEQARALVQQLAGYYPTPEAMRSLGVEPGAQEGSAAERWAGALERLHGEEGLGDLARRIARDEAVSAYEVQLVSGGLRQLQEGPGGPIDLSPPAPPEAAAAAAVSDAASSASLKLRGVLLGGIVLLLAVIAYVASLGSG